MLLTRPLMLLSTLTRMACHTQLPLLVIPLVSPHLLLCRRLRPRLFSRVSSRLQCRKFHLRRQHLLLLPHRPRPSYHPSLSLRLQPSLPLSRAKAILPKNHLMRHLRLQRPPQRPLRRMNLSHLLNLHPPRKHHLQPQMSLRRRVTPAMVLGWV